ncbi:tetraacyldisaccharide 4'-kinase [Candidatus Thiosymbion oneisti]|uniref:tetraacyldisaccharide 4'-kinase n=1 Tax=Candidatus Thiosymbion oneisti TaxID=589554 RepID=UPI002108681E|nr:tetraacyldisaccharide 4'-kinase [Candidatus Thiosymbion oneisti]
MMTRLAGAVWYNGHPLSSALLPLSWLYCGGVRLRRLAYRRGWLHSRRLPVPVIVVGNLTVGGTGKTPLVLGVTDLLRRRGYRPGILIRGYSGSGTRWPRLVTGDDDPFQVGDESVLLARRSGCPVVAGADRVAAGELLLANCECDMIVSDDGLQHYGLRRDLEILVIDASRRFGNGRCLPAGPLREPAARGRAADLTLCNGSPCPGGQVMRLAPGPLVNLADREITRDLGELRGQRVTAVAGIGNPDRFFAHLRRRGLHVNERPYPDHHPFRREDAASWPPGPVVMTEKDAVKCTGFARPDFWYLPVASRLPSGFEQLLLEKLKGIGNG